MKNFKILQMKKITKQQQKEKTVRFVGNKRKYIF